jgi:hypothetical protein
VWRAGVSVHKSHFFFFLFCGGRVQDVHKEESQTKIELYMHLKKIISKENKKGFSTLQVVFIAYLKGSWLY